jgi:hypothetical protein
MSQVLATFSEKLETLLDPFKRRSRDLCAKGSALVCIEYSPPGNKNGHDRIGRARSLRESVLRPESEAVTECNYSTGWRFYPGGFKINRRTALFQRFIFRFGCSVVCALCAHLALAPVPPVEIPRALGLGSWLSAVTAAAPTRAMRYDVHICIYIIRR